MGPLTGKQLGDKMGFLFLSHEKRRLDTYEKVVTVKQIKAVPIEVHGLI